VSRVAKSPVTIPNGVEVNFDGRVMSVKGPKGALALNVHENVEMNREGDVLTFAPKDASGWAITGTMRSLVNNMVTGVSEGFERKLELVGVGYRAQAQGNKVNLQLGFSHPVEHKVPAGVTVETPTQTEIIIRGADKQAVGETAAQIRAYRPPEPYKGKGVRYSDERVARKEAKKK
jgi:large subunit ribosomal protein L6